MEQYSAEYLKPSPIFLSEFMLSNNSTYDLTHIISLQKIGNRNELWVALTVLAFLAMIKFLAIRYSSGTEEKNQI